MTPRARRTDPIYNVCLRCGQVGHCSASCARGRGHDAVRYWNEYAKALTALQRKNRWQTAQALRGEVKP